jgi:hypothetical protein
MGHEVGRFTHKPVTAAKLQTQPALVASKAPVDKAETTQPTDQFLPSSARQDESHLYRPQGLKAGRPLVIDEQGERNFIGKNKPAEMVMVAPGGKQSDSKETVLTIHGISGSPQDMQALHQKADKEGKQAWTMVYDDRHRSLPESSKDMANSIREWRKGHPNQDLKIQAHSMGSRITLGAMQELKESGDLAKGKVQLELLAGPIGGLEGMTNSANMVPEFLGRLGPNIVPGKSMGNHSQFQKQLDQIDLPKNVTTKLVMGKQDELVQQTQNWDAMKARLHAKTEWLNATHDTIVDRYAAQ